MGKTRRDHGNVHAAAVWYEQSHSVTRLPARSFGTHRPLETRQFRRQFRPNQHVAMDLASGDQHQETNLAGGSSSNVGVPFGPCPSPLVLALQLWVSPLVLHKGATRQQTGPPFGTSNVGVPFTSSPFTWSQISQYQKRGACPRTCPDLMPKRRG